MDLNRTIWQFEGDDAPLVQVEHKANTTTDLPVGNSVGIEEGKSIMVGSGLGERVCSINCIQIPGNTKVIDVDTGGVDKKDDLMVHSQDKTSFVSLHNKGFTYSRRDKYTSTEVQKLENKDINSKLESEDGISLEERSNIFCDMKKDMNDENHLQPALVRKDEGQSALLKISNNSLMFGNTHSDEDSGTEEEQDNFFNELEKFHKDNSIEFRPPKFYGKGLNYLKLWRKVKKLGGYSKVSSKRMWRQVGESFKPPKTCTTVSWSFRNFYEKMSETSVLGRVKRESATLAMQRWSPQKSMRNVSQKRKTVPTIEDDKDVQRGVDNTQSKPTIIDMGSRADWVKINVFITKYHFQVYALVPGLLHEELLVLSDPIGRLIINGDPRQLDNPWGLTRFHKVIQLPSRINPEKTLTKLSEYGKLYVCGEFEKSSS
ncbi:AT-rich interactive domain-containing protein 5-like isoform X2 [Hordeum vulgare subsp. vulgare]|uniref:AT-rich interactive domain-containing protein 5-like isoform X2 n=1 Tax=Hordeum vulgare subsp. vulgare TaxID=112509 RepID=UPI001D1A38A5|nr:AT-rich interactive domain-containing protein 5-like isoform X2 [Hordeum vulgare subsp. vulgare]